MQTSSTINSKVRMASVNLTNLGYSVQLRNGSVHITGQFTDYSTADMWQMKAILDMFIFLSYCDACYIKIFITRFDHNL